MSSKPWKDYSRDEKNSFLLGNEKDCTFLVGMQGREEPREFKSFKFILCSVSPVFERMFNGNFKEAKDSEPVIITDAFACDFEAFLQLVHYSKSDTTRWTNVYRIVKKYMADGIVGLVKNFNCEMLFTPKAALQKFEIHCMENETSAILFNLVGLPTTYSQLLIQAINNVCGYLSEMSAEIILRLLKTQIAGYFKKSSFFEILANLEGKLPSKEIKEIISSYDFSDMTIRDYFDKVHCCSVIDEQMKFHILAGICRVIAKKTETEKT